MGNGGFFCRKKVTPQPFPIVATTETTVPKIAPKEKPYGYFKLFPGVKTSDNKYTTPVIALHMYTKEQKVTTQTKTTFNAPTSKTGRQNSFVPHSAPSSSTNVDKQEKEEKVRCIPIEDIISIEYSTEVKKEYATFETKQERQRSPKAKLGCWGLFQQCLREKCSCCCCPDCICDCCPTCMHNCCKTPPDEAPKYDTNTRRHVTANRMILIEMKCIQHSNIDIPTHVNVLPTDEKHKFYTENFNVDPIYFYLVNNTEPDQNDFQKKSSEAERFIRVVVQLRTRWQSSFTRLRNAVRSTSSNNDY